MRQAPRTVSRRSVKEPGTWERALHDDVICTYLTDSWLDGGEVHFDFGKYYLLRWEVGRREFRHDEKS